MENKKFLFITFDMSGYYKSVHEELVSRYAVVDFYNLATVSYKCKNVFEKAHIFFYKLYSRKKLKNYYKYQHIINQIQNNSYDIILVVRPDLFFDSQLQALKNKANYFVAYYHDSINNIKRKRDVIHFFNKVYSYEKKDVQKYNLEFLPNFIYFPITKNSGKFEYEAFSVMSNDYRLNALRLLAQFFHQNAISYNFYVKDKEQKKDELITFFNNRMGNEEVVEEIKKSKIIVDIHKFGVQNGLTFRVFEAIGFEKKLITTNKDVKNYDFYNPNNIYVIEDIKNITIPISFIKSSYEPISLDIVNKYTVNTWLNNILKH